MGIVTFMFSDIEDSTAINARLGDARWLEVLRAHSELVRSAIREHDGIEVKSQGDGFLVAFDDPGRALPCAAAIQRAVAEQARARPDEGLRVRIGLHCGEAVDVGDDLVGREVFAAARIGARARGGEILVSQTVRDAIADQDGFSFDEGRDVELGESFGARRLFLVTGDAQGALTTAALALSAASGSRAAPDRGPPPGADLGARAEGEAGEVALERLGTAFVGRAAERARLEALLSEAVAGRGAVAALSGEAGIGKTRLLEELGRAAREAGATVLWGRCLESDGAPAYWPWVQVLTSYVRGRDAQALREELGEGAPEVARLVPELRDLLPNLPEPPEGESQQERFRLFDAIATALRHSARDGGAVVILDDLHWADRPSLLLLQFLARELTRSGLLVVVSYRESDLDRRHPLAQTISELRREGLWERLALRGLELEEVRLLLADVSGQRLDDPAEALAVAVHSETDGNPLFLREVLRHLVETGRVYHRDGRWSSDASSIAQLGLPEGIREVIGLRLARLSEDCNRALAVAAAIGRSFDVDVLREASDLPLDALLDALEEASAASVLEELPERSGGYRFVHALVRETLYAELTTARRLLVHRRVGEALEAAYQGKEEEHLSELALHFREAAVGGEVEKAIRYATLAGDRAAGLLAYEEAAGHYEDALAALELARQPDRSRACDLVLAAGDAHFRAGDTSAARQSFARAAKLAGELGDRERLAEAALGFGVGLGGFGYSGTADEQLINLLTEALAALPHEDSLLRVRLMGRLAVELYYTQAAERRDKLSRAAVEMSLRLDDPRAQLIAHYSRHWSVFGPDDLEDRAAAAAEILRLADALGENEMAFYGHRFLLTTMLELGESAAVDAEVERCARLAERLRQPVFLWQSQVFQAMRAILRGRLAEGEQLGQEAFGLGQRGNAEMAAVLLGVQLVFLRSVQGRLGELEDAIRSFVDRYPDSSFRPTLAFLYAEAGNYDRGMAELDALAANDFADLRRDGNWLASVATLCLAAGELGDARRAELARELILPYRERLVVGSAGALCLGPATLYAGIAAGAAGLHDEAVADLEASQAAASRIDSPPLGTWTGYELGRVLAARDGEGDRERARELLEQALASSRELGMDRFVERIERLGAGHAGSPR